MVGIADTTITLSLPPLDQLLILLLGAIGERGNIVR